MKHAASLVAGFFGRRHFRYHLMPPGNLAQLLISTPDGESVLLVRWGADGGDLVQLTSQLPFRVPAARRAEFGLALHDLNAALPRAKITFLPACGSVEFRTAISLLRDESPEKSPEKGFDEHCASVASLLSPLAAMAFGGVCPLEYVSITAACLPPGTGLVHPSHPGQN